MIIAIYPGTFDPVTNGHLDVLRGLKSLIVIVAVSEDSSEKKRYLIALLE